MDVEITPKPRREEREALLAGIARLLSGKAAGVPPQYASAWRRAGLLEASAGDTERPRATPTGWREPRS